MATATLERDVVMGNLRGRVATFTAITDLDTYDTGLTTIYFAGCTIDEDVATADCNMNVTVSGGTVTFRAVAGTETIDTAKLFVLGT